MGVHGNQSSEATSPRPLAALVGASICAGVALLLTAATGLITFGLSESYGFGPGWDWSALMMTGVAASLAGTALLGQSALRDFGGERYP